MRDYYYYKNFLSSSLNLSNSRYTNDWLIKIYGSRNIKSRILYPPVDVSLFENSAAKKNAIICVGRFFVGGHNKKQNEVIKVFKKMCDDYPEIRNYTLHVCGGTHPEKAHQDYLKMCMLSAQGYPIEIHPNISFDELVKLYAESKIFWHAAGMKENEALNPDKFEHFGITTVEAMASGCIPVVIGVAGQKEIVKHRKNGMLWISEQELIDNTLELIRNEELCKKLAVEARRTSEEFSKRRFCENVETIFTEEIFRQSFKPEPDEIKNLQCLQY
jgi:glycosyltransferase involved in cell wall biosynthesis